MPLMRCEEKGESGWKYGQGGRCYTGSGAKKKAIRQGVAIEENGGPKFESRKDSKATLTEQKLDEMVARIITPEESRRDDLERELVNRAKRLGKVEGRV